MKLIFALFSGLIVVSVLSEEWMKPVTSEADVLTYVGYIRVERDKVYDVRAKEFGGNYFVSEASDGGKRVPLYSDWYHITSRIVGLKVRIAGKIRHMKSGDQIQIKTLEILNER